MNEAIRTIEKRKEPFTFNLLDLLVVFYMAHRLLPAVGQFTPGIVFLGAFAMTALMLCMSKRNRMNTSDFTKIVFVFSMSILTLVMNIMRDSTAVVFTYIYGQLQAFLYGWIALYYVSQESVTKARRLLKLVVAFYAITMVTTYVGNIIYPQASRWMATFTSTNPAYRLYTSLNIGGFGFIYEIALLTPIIIYMIKSGRLSKLWGTVILVFAGMVLLKAEYTMALLLFLSTISLLFVKFLSVKKVIAIVLVIVIVTLVLGGVVADFLDSLSNTITSSTMSVRLKYIAASLRGEEFEGIDQDDAESSDRIVLYKKAFSQMVETKFMGSWGEVNGSGHSFILDNVVRFGILGILAIVIAYRMLYCIAVKPHKNKDYYPYIMWMYFMAIVLAALNTTLNQNIFIFMIPMITRVFDYYDMQRKEAGTDE